MLPLCCCRYLEERTIKDLVKKHSEFIAFPIYLAVDKTQERELSDSEEEEEEDEKKEGEAEEVKKEPKDKKKKTVKEVTREWQLLNKQKPIWMRKPEAVSAEEYGAFYKALTNDWDEVSSCSNSSSSRRRPR